MRICGDKREDRNNALIHFQGEETAGWVNLTSIIAVSFSQRPVRKIDVLPLGSQLFVDRIPGDGEVCVLVSADEESVR